jgi:hypothetical protein
MRIQIEVYSKESLLLALKKLGVKDVAVKTIELHLGESEHEFVPRIEAEFILGDFQSTEIAAVLRKTLKSKQLRMLAIPAQRL